MSILNQRDGQKMFVDAFRPSLNQLPPEALRARLQDCQSAGFKLAQGALEREQQRRERKEQARVEQDS